MPHIEDGTVLAKRRWPWQRDTLAFGWLDTAQPFRTGAVPEGVVEALEEAARHPVDRTRGFHTCGLCPAREWPGPTPHPTRRGDTLQLGTASLEVLADGARWVAPNLVVHYVTEHGYVPPDEVLRALGG